MIDDNFVLYLKTLGFVPNTNRHEEYIDIIVSDKTTVEKNLHFLDRIFLIT